MFYNFIEFKHTMIKLYYRVNIENNKNINIVSNNVFENNILINFISTLNINTNNHTHHANIIISSQNSINHATKINFEINFYAN